MNTVLAIDIGTSSTRARLYALDSAEPVPSAAAHRDHAPTATADGGSELDPRQLLAETVACCREALDRAPAGTRVAGVGMATFWHSVLGVDAHGEPTTPVLMWSDRRSGRQVARLRAEDPDAPRRTGCPWHVSYAAGRLAWLREMRGGDVAASATFLSPGAWILGQLHGQADSPESTSMASASGLWNHTERTWDTAVLAAIGIDAVRLPIVDDAPRVGLVGDAARSLPELADVPWFPAIGDGAASNLGCGAGAPGRMALMIGTSGALRTPVAPGAVPALPDGLWRYLAGPERWLLGGALSNGGSLWAWCEDRLGLPPDAGEAIAALRPDAHGLAVLPFFAGERAPLWRDDLTAAVVGLRTDTTSVEIARAALESVAYRFAAIRDRLRPVAPAARIVGTGAALLASPAWRRILVDVLGEPMETSAEEEASARGAALAVREALGHGAIDAAPVPRSVEILEPDPSTRDAYAEGRARHAALLEALHPMGATI